MLRSMSIMYMLYINYLCDKSIERESHITAKNLNHDPDKKKKKGKINQ